MPPGMSPGTLSRSSGTVTALRPRALPLVFLPVAVLFSPSSRYPARGVCLIRVGFGALRRGGKVSGIWAMSSLNGRQTGGTKGLEMTSTAVECSWMARMSREFAFAFPFAFPFAFASWFPGP